jgi:hypothetical protein
VVLVNSNHLRLGVRGLAINPPFVLEHEFNETDEKVSKGRFEVEEGRCVLFYEPRRRRMRVVHERQQVCMRIRRATRPWCFIGEP